MTGAVRICNINKHARKLWITSTSSRNMSIQGWWFNSVGCIYEAIIYLCNLPHNCFG